MAGIVATRRPPANDGGTSGRVRGSKLPVSRTRAQELRRLGVHRGSSGKIGSMTDEDLKALFAALQRENAGMREENAAAHAETRRHFEVLTEGTRKDIQIVAESVAVLNEKLDREAGDIREEMRRGFTETQAMIKFLPRGDRPPDA